MDHFSILISPRAQQEIEQAIDFYAQRSHLAPQKFMTSLDNAYKTLELNPFFGVLYKNIRSLKLYQFPFSLFFIVNETKKVVKVLSCFHTKRNPVQAPKR
jgi:plasmid stabilization system protein ParE